eukprot:2026061-Amphidinium_carterae.1
MIWSRTHTDKGCSIGFDLVPSFAQMVCSEGAHGRDKVWSNNNIGDGKNWLGMQLMLLRDKILTGYGRQCALIQSSNNLNALSFDSDASSLDPPLMALMFGLQGFGLFSL